MGPLDILRAMFAQNASCDGCDEHRVIQARLSDSLQQEHIELNRGVDEINKLKKELQRRIQVYEARSTLFWDSLKREHPEVEDIDRLVISDDHKMVEGFSCASCSGREDGE